MTVPFWCLLITILIPVALGVMGGAARAKAFGTADNHQPRAQAAKLEGQGARIYAAQENAWEAVALFTAAVMVAHLAGASEGTSAIVAVVFVVARVAHAVCYIQDLATPRSLAFGVALFSCLGLFGLAAAA